MKKSCVLVEATIRAPVPRVEARSTNFVTGSKGAVPMLARLIYAPSAFCVVTRELKLGGLPVFAAGFFQTLTRAMSLGWAVPPKLKRRRCHSTELALACIWTIIMTAFFWFWTTVGA